MSGVAVMDLLYSTGARRASGELRNPVTYISPPRSPRRPHVPRHRPALYGCGRAPPLALLL